MGIADMNAPQFKTEMPSEKKIQIGLACGLIGAAVSIVTYKLVKTIWLNTAKDANEALRDLYMIAYDEEAEK